MVHWQEQRKNKEKKIPLPEATAILHGASDALLRHRFSNLCLSEDFHQELISLFPEKKEQFNKIHKRLCMCGRFVTLKANDLATVAYYIEDLLEIINGVLGYAIEKPGEVPNLITEQLSKLIEQLEKDQQAIISTMSWEMEILTECMQNIDGIQSNDKPDRLNDSVLTSSVVLVEDQKPVLHNDIVQSIFNVCELKHEKLKNFQNIYNPSSKANQLDASIMLPVNKQLIPQHSFADSQISYTLEFFSSYIKRRGNEKQKQKLADLNIEFQATNKESYWMPGGEAAVRIGSEAISHIKETFNTVVNYFSPSSTHDNKIQADNSGSSESSLLNSEVFLKVETSIGDTTKQDESLENSFLKKSDAGFVPIANEKEKDKESSESTFQNNSLLNSNSFEVIDNPIAQPEKPEWYAAKKACIQQLFNGGKKVNAKNVYELLKEFCFNADNFEDALDLLVELFDENVFLSKQVQKQKKAVACFFTPHNEDYTDAQLQKATAIKHAYYLCIQTAWDKFKNTDIQNIIDSDNHKKLIDFHTSRYRFLAQGETKTRIKLNALLNTWVLEKENGAEAQIYIAKYARR